MRRKSLSEMSLSNRRMLGDLKVVRRSTALSAFCWPTSCPNPTRLLASNAIKVSMYRKTGLSFAISVHKMWWPHKLFFAPRYFLLLHQSLTHFLSLLVDRHYSHPLLMPQSLTPSETCLSRGKMESQMGQLSKESSRPCVSTRRADRANNASPCLRCFV
ncbi:hypothetical protein D6D01_03608 [Aureobasidium pullulans]|uniref:Uncharacterized protein n=1 Tax=Aureobasidium pullulans TaxID=5580 RepID=A0A4S9LIC8_AURPU|nr:hypothetical protein D6D01_03608 [Aureobasidium pullulans]